jgi:tripartite ATP-independent transporter DctP family solute receptor
MTITRRIFTGAAATALAMPALIRGAQAAEFTFKMGTSTPTDHPFNTRLMDAGERMKKDSNGRMEFLVFPDSQLGGDNDLLSQARSGAIQFCPTTGQIMSTILPAAAINAMGFVFSNYDQVWSAMDGALGSFVRQQIMAKTELYPMEKMWDLGFRQTTTSNRPIKVAKDFEGLKLRVPIAPSLVAIFRALKAAPVGMQYGEVYSALQTHVVDGQENPLSQVASGKFYEVQKYVSMTNHVWDGYWLCCNAAAWKRLPSDLQTIVARSLNEIAIPTRVELAKLNETTKADLLKGGMVFNDTTPETFQAQLRSSGFYSEWRAKLGNEPWELLEKYVGKLG